MSCAPICAICAGVEMSISEAIAIVLPPKEVNTVFPILHAISSIRLREPAE